MANKNSSNMMNNSNNMANNKGMMNNSNMNNMPSNSSKSTQTMVNHMVKGHSLNHKK